MDSYLRLLQNCTDPTMLRYLAGNVDNTLLQGANSARDARFSFIDNIANDISGVRWYERYLSAVLSETFSDGGPQQSTVAQFEFIRWTLRVSCNGFVASDAALREVRLRFLYALRQYTQSGALAWIDDKELDDVMDWSH